MKSSPEPSTVESKNTGYVHSVETFGTVDGPGIRLVIFLQGCPMRCLYCHNPDTWNPRGGHPMSVSEILKLYEKNKTYYVNGGITVTGGEPLMQLSFLTELFEAAKEKNIHTCLDTSGILFRSAKEADYARLLASTDLILLDLKHSNPQGHKQLTGHSQNPVLDFLSFTERQKVCVIIRHVIVEGITDSPQELDDLGKLIATHKNIKGLEVLPYHNMGEQKYQELGLEYPLKGMENLPKEQAAKARQRILQSIAAYRKTI